MDELEIAFKAGFNKEAGWEYNESKDAPLNDRMQGAIPESLSWGGVGALVGTMTPGKYDAFTNAAIGAGAPLVTELLEYSVGNNGNNK